MKKILALILACLCLFSLVAMVGCAKEEAGAETPATGTQTPAGDEVTPPAGGDTTTPPAGEGAVEIDLAATKPNEYVQEKLDAGMKPLITFVVPRLASDFLKGIDNGLKTNFEALGYSYTTSNADNDLSKIIELVENAVMMQSAAVIVLDIGEGLADVCANAEEAGTHIVCFGNPPLFDVAGKVLLDQGEQGMQAVKMALAWVDQKYPNAGAGEIKAFITTEASTEQNKARSEAYEQGLLADPRINLVYKGEHLAITTDEGFTLAQNAFTLDPDIRLALAFNSAAAVGINNYIVANATADLDEYGVFANTIDAALTELVNAGTEGGSVLRGTIAQGWDEGPWASAFRCATALLTGGAEYGYVQYDRLYAMNNFGYVYDSEA